MIRTLDDLDAAGAAVGVRVDINSPVAEDGSISDDARLRAHVDTISELADRDARVAVLAHQGRPGGDDFTTLAAHAERLDDLLDAPVTYVDATFSSDARRHVERLDDGSVLVLENTRFYSEEYLSFDPADAGETYLVEKLATVLDVYVNDAFATAHRRQPSIVGFPERLPSFAGRVMEAELDALGDIESTATPRVYVLGGAKAADSIEVADAVLSAGLADAVLTTGVVGNAFLLAAGLDIGEANEALVRERADDMLPRARELLDDYPDRIHLPVDLAIDRDGERVVVGLDELPVEESALDIGRETVEAYGLVLADAGTAILNGPAGVYEDAAFAYGTEALFTAAQDAGYTIVGGGDTAAALRALGLSGFDHVSTGGGAALAMLTGESLPGVEALDS